MIYMFDKIFFAYDVSIAATKQSLLGVIILIKNTFHTRLSSNDMGYSYVDGIFITLKSPHKYVWTYAVGFSDDLIFLEGSGCSYQW